MPTIQCQFCGCDLVENLVLCQDCSTPHHEDCFRCNGICTTYACGCTTFVQAEDGAAIELPAIDTGAKNSVLNKAEKAVVTPTDIPVTHHYHRELGIHRFFYDICFREPTIGSRGLAVSIIAWFLLAFFDIKLAYSLALPTIFFVAAASTNGTRSRGEIVINNNHLTFTSDQTEKELVNADELDEYHDIEEFRYSRYIYTVARADIEAIKIIQAHREGCEKVIKIEAKGKIRAYRTDEEEETLVDSFEIRPWMDHRAMEWLMLCIEHLATAKKF